jgi:phage terminase large subunit-like protein
LNISVSLDDMRDMCLKAKNSPSKQNEFKTKKLNIWTETLTRWITSEAWDACGAPVDVDGLAGRKCVGAFDLSSVSDLTAWVLCFKPDVAGEPYRLIFRFFLPQYDLEKRFVSKDILNQIQNWIRQGFITATPGNSIDYDFVKEQIKSDAERFDIKEIPYDPYNATQIVNDLMKDGFEMLPFRQGYLTMSPAAKSFEAAVLDKKIAHGNNPVMKWMIACTDVQSVVLLLVSKATFATHIPLSCTDIELNPAVSTVKITPSPEAPRTALRVFSCPQPSPSCSGPETVLGSRAPPV